MEAYQRRGGTKKRRGRVTRVISTMETGLSTGGGSPGCLGSKVRDYNIPGMPFRVHQFGTPVPSLRSSQPREDLLLLLLRPSSPRPLPPRRSRIRRVRATRRSRAILSRKDLLSAGIGKRFIFPALFSPPVRYPSLSHVCSSGSASVSS